MKKAILLILFFTCIYANAQINFQDVANTLGLSDATGPTIFGGAGVSFVDYNQDGFDDITILKTDTSLPIFYRNIDGLLFSKENLLPNSVNYEYRTRSASWVDFDNDGDLDFFMTSDTNGSKLFRNDDGDLLDVTVSSGLPIDNLNTWGASWGDINNDGCLDVYLSNRSLNTPITNYLFKNNCDGTFVNITNSSGVGAGSILTFCSAFFDFNNDGFQDLYLANDKNVANILFKNNGDETFTDVSVSSGADVIVGAMSVTVDDYNSDGFFDIFITNSPNGAGYDEPGTLLLKNNGNETFTNVTSSSDTSFVSFSWGSNFLDADNDGDLDLYMNSEYAVENPYPTYGFYTNDNDGTFSRSVNSGFLTNNYNSYSSAIGDYDNDGNLDIVSYNSNNQPMSLWKNNVNNNNYLKIELLGTESNKFGVGSIIEISVNGVQQFRHVLLGEGYLSQNSFIEHFGVGNSTNIDYVKVKWLSGQETIINNVSVNQKMTIVEGTTLAVDGLSDDKAISLYPNPAKTFTMLQSKNVINKYCIYDISGKKIIENNTENKFHRINLKHIKPGIYMIQIVSDGQRKILRFLKD